MFIKTFKFNLKLEEDREISNSDINRYNNSLQKYGLFSFQNRILNKLLLFLYNVKSNCSSPLILKKSLNVDQNCVNINDNLIKLTDGKNIVKYTENINRFSQLTFCYFFQKDISKLHKFKFFNKTYFHLKKSF